MISKKEMKLLKNKLPLLQKSDLSRPLIKKEAERMFLLECDLNHQQHPALILHGSRIRVV
jgi:hypothetical protein